MWKEEDYFDNANRVVTCHECAEKLYHGDTVYEDESGKCFCSDECVSEYLAVRLDTGDECECANCSQTFVDFEDTLTALGEMFCDLECALQYYNITSVEL